MNFRNQWNELKQQYLDWFNKINAQNNSLMTSTFTHETDNNNEQVDNTDQEFNYPKGCVLEFENLDPNITKPIIRSQILQIIPQHSDLAFIEYKKALNTVSVLKNIEYVKILLNSLIRLL